MYTKTLLTTITVLFISSLFSPVFAQTKTPTLTPKITESKTKASPTPAKSEPTASEAADLNRIQKIKDMVASRVAELKLVEKRGILGTVKEVSSSQVTVRDNKGEQRIIDIDELTKFQGKISSSSKKTDDDTTQTFGISDIKVGEEVAFIGLYNKQTDRLLARIVLLPKSIPFYMDGVISDIDTKEYTFAISNNDEKRIVDFEKSTTAKLFTKADGIKKSGFSTIEAGQRAIIVGFEDSDNKHIIATRILHFSDVPPSSEMKKGLSLEPEEASPSATLTPTKKIVR
jgi:hypothetical protein